MRKTSVPNTEPLVRRYRSFFVALFVAVPLFVMPALLIFAMVKSDIFQQWCTLHVVYENSQGLKKGNQVSMSGITIGYVNMVELVKEGEIHVDFNINARYTHLVKKDTKARLQQRGFVGDWEIDLAGGSGQAAVVKEGDTLKTERVPSIDYFIELAVGIVDTAMLLFNDVATILKGIEAGEGTVGQLFKNDTLFRQINQISANTAALTFDARKVTREVGDAIKDTRGTIRNVDSLLLTVTGVAADIGKSSTAAVDTVIALIATVNKSLNEVELILKNIKTVSDDAPELMDRLQHDLGEVEMMLRSFQDGWLFRSIGGRRPINPHLAETP